MREAKKVEIETQIEHINLVQAQSAAALEDGRLFAAWQ